MARYKIWDKQEEILTPSGIKYTAEQWQEEYPISKYVDIVISGGEVNGAFYHIYSQFKESYERMGLDFSKCKTQQAVLDKIEEYENEQSKPVDPTDWNELIAYALQDIAINTMSTEV